MTLVYCFDSFYDKLLAGLHCSRTLGSFGRPIEMRTPLACIDRRREASYSSSKSHGSHFVIDKQLKANVPADEESRNFKGAARRARA